MKHAIQCIALLLAICISACQAETLFMPYKDDNEKWGYADTEGNIVIKPTWDMVTFFRGGSTAIVEKTSVDGSGLQGIINSSGEYLVPCNYLIIEDEGGSLFGGIEGYYLVWNKDRSLMGFYDIKNSYFCEPKFYDVCIMQEYDSHMIAVAHPQTKMYAYIDAPENLNLTKYVYYEAGPVFDGYAIARAKDGYKIVTETGQAVPIDASLSASFEILHGLFIVYNEEGYWLMNLQGRIISEQYDYIEIEGTNFLGTTGQMLETVRSQ